MKLGELLLRDEVITERQLIKALDYQSTNSPEKRMGEILIKLSVVPVSTIQDYLERQIELRSRRSMFV